ncbi:hypothetical protein [Cytophaga sp. FL35]|uniref:hypothetical protein n=1 Tax=Cytophaga sp. FL35 TaxID=1904456 RepID=UPI00165346BE|nr:hypothetical protein [Cytophaga sp. FL35]MBC6999642.1 hypothetical protein [Cytophaga sp. FL35]
MTSIEFADKLKSLAPSKESLSRLGVDDEFIKHYLNSYNLKRIKNEIAHIDPILNLINNHDVSNFDIGMINLNSADDVFETEKNIIVGSYDADMLAIDKITDEIVILDWENPDYVISRCSKDSETFLYAILEVAKINKEMFFDEGLSENQQAIKEKSMEIAGIAGDERYLNFYLTILGYSGE